MECHVVFYSLLLLLLCKLFLTSLIKIASNSNTYGRMRDNMDVNAGRIAERSSRFAEWDQ